MPQIVVGAGRDATASRHAEDATGSEPAWNQPLYISDRCWGSVVTAGRGRASQEPGSDPGWMASEFYMSYDPSGTGHGGTG
tara:strand:+ start:1237 stop:1479 length:243 start_codon:yes stop_codon:yes gene_type:complete